MSWVDYVLSSDDLWCNGICTEAKAEEHRRQHVNEHRSIKDHSQLITAITTLKLPAGKRKRLVAELGTPYFFCGLFNQLNTLAALIVLGHIVNADILVRGFYPQFQNYEHRLPLSQVINLPAMNNLFTVLGLRTRLLDWKGEIYPPSKTPRQQNLISYAQLSVKTRDNADLGQMYGHEAATPGSPVTERLYSFLLAKCRFNPTFYRVADKIRQQLGLKSYPAVHLRLEKDTKLYTDMARVSYRRFQAIHTYNYRLWLHSLPSTQPVFVASGLSEQELLQWRQEFPQLRWKPSNWRASHPDLPLGREIDAIIDYLLCVKGSVFYGWARSTFALNVARCGGTCHLLERDFGVEVQ